MRRHLNTLYLNSDGGFLSRERGAFLVKVDGESRSKVPARLLDGIVCFGGMALSSGAIALCGEQGVALSFLSRNGRFQGRVHGPTSGNVLLRREQYRRADNEAACTAIARAIVIGKVLNSRTVLRRALRDHPDSSDAGTLEHSAERLGHALAALRSEPDLEQVRGHEGVAAQTYFRAFNGLLTNQRVEFAFSGRSRRPPLDRINALLSFLYALLVHDTASAIEAVGLDPAVGFLHRDRPGRPGLALDLMEEFRAVVADRLAVTLVNRGQLDATGFKQTESGGVHLREAGRRIVIEAFQERKSDQLKHPFLEEQVSVGLLPHLQAQLLARYLRADLDAYPPFVWR